MVPDQRMRHAQARLDGQGSKLNPRVTWNHFCRPARAMRLPEKG